MWGRGGTCTHVCMCEGQRTACGNWLSPSTMWGLGIKFRSSTRPGGKSFIHRAVSPTADEFWHKVTLSMILFPQGHSGHVRERKHMGRRRSAQGGYMDPRMVRPYRFRRVCSFRLVLLLRNQRSRLCTEQRKCKRDICSRPFPPLSGPGHT